MGDAFVIDSDRPGGAQRVTYDLVKKISKEDNSNKLVFFRKHNTKSNFILNVYIFGLSNKFIIDKIDRFFSYVFGRFYRFLMSPIYSLQLYIKLRSENFDRLFLVSDVSFSHFWFIKFLHKNVVVILHSKKSVQYKISSKPINKLLFRWSVSGIPLLAISRSIADDLELFNLKNNDIKIRYNYTDQNRIFNLSDLYSKNHYKKDSYYLFVGRLSQEKNVDLIIQHFLMSQSKTELVICGDGPEFPMLKKMITKSGVKNIHLLGHVENPYPLIKNARALLLLSTREGFPTVIKEALYLHTPVISNTSFLELEQILINGNERFIVRNNNPLFQIIECFDSGKINFNFGDIDINKFEHGDLNDI